MKIDQQHLNYNTNRIDETLELAYNQVALTPINEKVRKAYENIGFESIEESGSNKFEDWMVFNY